MVKIKDHPRYQREGDNQTPLYAAIWQVGKLDNRTGKIVYKEIGSGWRNDMADTVALAIRMNGYVMRGYFSR